MMDVFGIEKFGKLIRRDRLQKFETVILQHAKDNDTFYIDQVDFDALTCGSQDENYDNLIGTAIRTLIQLKAIHKTGNYRKSTKKGSRGRTIFEYQIGG